MILSIFSCKNSSESIAANNASSPSTESSVATYKIPSVLKASVVFCFGFDELPEVAKEYAKMSAAYKFVKRELGSQAVCQYTQEDFSEARIALEQHELEIGNYTMIPDMYNGNIRSSI